MEIDFWNVIFGLVENRGFEIQKSMFPMELWETKDGFMISIELAL